MKFLQFLFIVNILLGFALGMLILFKPFLKSNTNKYLGYAVLTVSFIMLNIVLKETGFYDQNDLLYIFYDIEWMFLFPVFTFFFIVLKTGHDLSAKKELHLLYLPFVFSFILNLINNLERDFELFNLNSSIAQNIKSSLFSFENTSVYIFQIILLIWLYFILKKHSEPKKKNWLWRLWRINVALVVLWIILDFIEHSIQADYASDFSVILIIGMSFFLYWISYNTIYKSKLAAEVAEITQLLSNQQKALTPEAEEPSKNTHFIKFEHLFKTEHIYRDPNITRELVAEKLEISPGYLSQLINANGNENFSMVVNQFRVNEVKIMLCDPTFNKYNIESIGLEAGFSSKTTFYTVFKKFTGMTPKAFKNQHE